VGRERWIVLALLGGLYLYTMAPSVYVHDAGELTTAAWTLGIGHPPGAPMYMMLCKLFLSVVPLGHIAWRASLFSAVMALLAFWILAGLAFRITGNRVLSLTAALAAGLSPVLWSQAEMAEVYTLEVVLLLLFFSSLPKKLDDDCPPLLSAFLWGLLLTCHMGLVPLTPLVLGLLAWPVRRDFRTFLVRLIRIAPAFLLPLSLYLYLPVRSLQNPAMDWGNPETLQNFFWHLTNRQVRGRMLTLPVGAYLTRTFEYVHILWSNLLLLLPLAMAGLWFGWKRKNLLAWMALPVVLADGAFIVFADTAPLASEAYAIPSVIGLVLLSLFALTDLHQRYRWMEAGKWMVLGAVLAWSFVPFPYRDVHENLIIRDTVEAVLAQVPAGGALFTWEDNTTFPLAYLTLVEGARPDMDIWDRQGNLFQTVYDRPLFLLNEGELTRYRQSKEEPKVTALLKEGRAVVFSDPFLEYIPTSWHLLFTGTVAQAVLPGTRVLPALPPPQPRVNARPDWMSRQVLASDLVRRARGGDGGGEALARALYLSDLAPLDLRIAQMARDFGDHDLSLKSLDQALKIDPYLAPALSLKGFILLQSGKNEESRAVLKRAIDLDPSLPQPPSTLGLLSVEEKKWKEAEAWFSRSLELDPGQAATLYNRARARLQLGKTEGAKEDLVSALQVDTTLFPARSLLLDLLRQQESLEESEAVLCGICKAHKPSDLSPEWLASFLVHASRLHFPSCIHDWLIGSGLEEPWKTVADSYLKVESGVRREKEIPPREQGKLERD